MVGTQQIRLSQFVITYGPGAILEGPDGPRIIPRPDLGLFRSRPRLSPEKFEISDQRMSRGLLGGARLFRLPSNAEIGQPDSYYIYRTKPFPSWSQCLNTAGHAGDFAVLYQGEQCPVCGAAGRRRKQAIRFVVACSAGHMDDVGWRYLVHRGHPCDHGRWFRWHGVGGSLGAIEIECPRCSRRESLGRAYAQEWRCSGRFPEREALDAPPNRSATCDRNCRIIFRQASNLRLTELRTLFTVPRRHTGLHLLLQLTPIYAALTVLGESGVLSRSQFERGLEQLESQGLIPHPVLSEIVRHPWAEIEEAIRDVLSPVQTELHDLLLEEFQALIHGSEHGIPPRRGPSPTSPVLLEVNPHHIRRFPRPLGMTLRTTPVSRLRTVTVQVGYRRAIGSDPADLVDVSCLSPGVANERWYPAVEFLGEGIFIMLDGNDGWHPDLVGEAADNWRNALSSPGLYSTSLFRAPQSPHHELHPLFVWWHTFAHLLIRAISVEAGYSSASIRERVYLETGHTGARGGIILYATQPGTDGTLGGLIALVPYFNHILDTAFDMLRSCSNDPLCLDNHFRPGQPNGAACYGCLLVSETSCEHRNLWLDREILLENMP